MVKANPAAEAAPSSPPPHSVTLQVEKRPPSLMIVMSQPENAPRARADVLFRKLDDEWVVFDPTANQLHVLNLPAAIVWTHCTGELDTGEIADVLGRAYGIETERARSDVVDVVGRFSDAGLLVSESETG